MYRIILKEGQKCVLNLQYKRHSSNNTPRQTGFSKVFVLLAPIAAVGGVISYARSDEEFRKSVEKNVPGMAALLKLVLEEKPFGNITQKTNNVNQQIGSVTSLVTSFFGNSGDQKPDKSQPESQSNVSGNKYSLKPPTPAITKLEVTLPADVVGLEKEVEMAASLAVQEYNKAINILKSFNDDVRKILDKSVEDIDPTSWTTLKNKTSARDSSVGNAEKLAIKAFQKIEKCEIALSKVTSPANHELVLEVRTKIKTLIDHINEVQNELYKSKQMATLSENYWKRVEASRNYFIDQIESIFPGINIADKKLQINQDDLDLFILHVFSHVFAYQKELQRLQTEGELRLKRAIDAYRGEDKYIAISDQVDFYLEKEKHRLAIENQNKILQIRSDSEKRLRKQLKQQSEAHVDHLNDAIALKESELRRNFCRQFEEKLTFEKTCYKLQLAEMLGKMRGMDAALKARAESERSAQQAQALWAACQALWATIQTGEPGVHWKNKLRPLKSEIIALEKFSEADELVSVVLKNLPKTAENRGVFTEDALRERFLNVEKVVRKVALVPEEGAHLPIYLLSYLQSLFISRPDNPVTNKELENESIDFSKADTFDIINKARYFVDRGDLMPALKYMNLLQGAPRKVASDWLKEARLLLETQQAVNTLMAHAAASGVLYL